MTKTLLTVAAVLAVAAPSFACDTCGCKDKKHEAAHASGEAHAHDIVDTAVEAEAFSTLVAAVKAADLVETLKGDGPFTVFAPTDEAFKKLPEGTVATLLKPENKEKLIKVLTYHVVPGKIMSTDVSNGDSAETVNGKKLTVKIEGETATIGGAKIVKTDIECTNGVIHVIDTVMLP